MRAEASTWRRTAARCLIASTLVTAAPELGVAPPTSAARPIRIQP